jgi:hypothetical protein
LTSKPEQLQVFISGNVLNFFILPGGAKYIRIFHHAFMIAPQPTSALSSSDSSTEIAKEQEFSKNFHLIS